MRKITKSTYRYIVSKLQKKLRPLDVEYIMAVDIDEYGDPIHFITLSKGETDKCCLSMKAFRSHIKRYHPRGIIVSHNHPKNLGFPSEEDIKITEKMVEVCKECKVKFIDHIIILKDYEDYYFSFASNDYYMEITGMKRKKENQEDHYE